jgi:hypothetical protein
MNDKRDDSATDIWCQQRAKEKAEKERRYAEAAGKTDRRSGTRRWMDETEAARNTFGVDEKVMQNIQRRPGEEAGSNGKAKKAHEGNGKAEPPPARLSSRRFADMRMRPVRWLVPDFIPRGSLTVVAGDGGFGKSVLTLHLAACLTNGAPCFGLDYDPPPVGRVLLVNCEDGNEDTVLPRLGSAGAALDLVEALGDVTREGDTASPFTLSPSSLAALEALIRERGDVLAVVIDPVSAFVPDQLDDHKDAHVRRMLRPLAELAERTGVAIILIKHLNKSDSGNGGNLVSGSRGYVNAARAAFLLGPDPEEGEGGEDAEDAVLVFCKRNLTTRRRGLKFRKTPLSWEEQDAVLALPQAADLSDEEKECLRGQLFRLEWLGDTDATAADLARARRGKGDREDVGGRIDNAATWLAEFLKGGPRPSKEVLVAGRAARHSRNALYGAKEHLGVRVTKAGFSGKCIWYWSLPAEVAPGTP